MISSTLAAILIISLITGFYIGYVVGRTRTFGNTKLSPLQIFGMSIFIMYFAAAVANLQEFNDVTISIILTFIGSEAAGEFIKSKVKS